jgi:hypothetical protein
MNWIFPWLATAMALTLGMTQPTTQEHPSPKPSAAASAPASAPGDIFSKRALRRAQLIVQMRMLELREERLEQVRAAIERRLPPDLLCPRI